MNTPVTLAANAVTINNGKAVTNSLLIARTFHKRHKDVLKAIANLDAPTVFCGRNFAPTSFTVFQPNGGTRLTPGYLVTRDGFSLLAMGFTGRAAMLFKIAYIEAFNRMERTLYGNADPRTVDLWKLYGTSSLISALRQIAPRNRHMLELNRAEAIAALEMYGETPASIRNYIEAIRYPGGDWIPYPLNHDNEQTKGGNR